MVRTEKTSYTAHECLEVDSFIVNLDGNIHIPVSMDFLPFRFERSRFLKSKAFNDPPPPQPHLYAMAHIRFQF